MTVDERQAREPGDGPVDRPAGRPAETCPLDRLLAEEAPVPVPRALDLVRPLAREIDRLHARGTIHGAVRPWQIVVAPGDPAAREARLVLGPGMPTTATACSGQGAGGADRPVDTSALPAERDAAYRSPQLLAGEEARPADDLYALGVVAYELVTGALPFEAGTAASPVRGPVPPGERRAGLPSAVEGVLLAQVSAAPASRFATGLQFVWELERAATSDHASARTASISALMGTPVAVPTFRRAPAGLRARHLALAELPDVTRAPRDRPRPRRVRRNDYPDLGLPGLWVAVIVAVLCSVYLLPGFYMYVLPAYRALRGLAVTLFPHLFGPG